MKTNIPKMSRKPATPAEERSRAGAPTEKEVDEAIDESFPASDPPSLGGSTRIESGNDQKRHRAPAKKPREPAATPSPSKSHGS